MKQELADIKSAMQTVDLGDSDQLEKMVKRANELNEALKKIEESYGQFGRNVGNYQSAFDGMQKVSVTVGGVVREFNSAREASKTLKNELIGLEAAGQGDSEMAKQLRTELYKLQSAMDDATKSSKAMDEAMDFMQSFTAMASVGTGIKAFFGFDDNEIQKSIQRLVALQNVLQGIETLRKQMETGEGFGKFFKGSFEQIDAANFKLKRLIVSLQGTGTAAKVAAVGVNALSVAAKALASIGIVALISAVAWAAQKAVEEISNWVKGNADLVNSESRLKAALDATNDSLERNLRLNQAKYDAGRINAADKQVEDEKAYAQAIKEANAELEKRMKLNSNNSTFANAASNAGAKSWDDFLKNDKGVTTLGGFTEAAGSIDELIKRYKALDDAVSKNTGLVYKNAKGFEICHLSASDARDELNHLEQFMAGQLVGTMKQFDLSTEHGRQSLQNFVNGIMQSDNDIRKSVLLRLPEIVDNEKGNLGDALNGWLQVIKQFVANADEAMNALNFEKYANSLIDAADETGKRLADRQRENLKAQYNMLSEEDKKRNKKLYEDALAAIDKGEDKKRKKVSDNYKKLEKEIREAENDLANLRIANMKEGLNKVLKQLEEERKQRLAKVVADGRLIAERQAEINILYDKKILDAKKEWAEKVEKAYRDMWDNIYNYSLETTNKIADLMSQNYENKIQGWDIAKTYKLGGGGIFDVLPDYGVQGYNQLTKSTQDALKVEQDGNKEIQDIYKKRIAFITDYWTKRRDDEKSFVKEIYDAQIKVENESYQKELRDSKAHYDDMIKTLDKNLESGLTTQEEYFETSQRLFKDWTDRDEALRKQHNSNIEKLEYEKNNKIRNINIEFFNQRLQELRDFQTAIANLESKQPVYNFFGTTNFKQTNANNRILLESYKKVADEIADIKKQLQEKLKAQQITFDDFQNANRELDAFVDNVGQKMDEVKYKLSIGGQIQQFVQDMQQYIQAAVQSFDQIMNAVWDAQDVQFEKQQELLDKMNEELDKKLDEQQEIVERHKDAIDSIEEELANSRGARRQHLIDQINAEMAAQRAAQKQEQKIAKEKEALAKKQEKLDIERRKAEYKRNMLQAIVNGALAVTMAAVNAWPMPAIAMMAAAAAATAAQIAIMASNKPYAKGGQLDGGVAVGNRHRDGGIKVLGGRAEIEGGEFITNRLTTEKNIDLLDYINSKKKRINLDDLMEFYSSGKVKRNISSISPKAKFADGGTIPTISNDYAFDDRLLSAFEDYSNRPVVVSVVDINNRQSAVKNVQVLAGLPE